MKTETEQKVLEWIDRRQDYLNDFLRNLIAIPSVTGDELEIQKFIARKLESTGLEVDLWEPDHEQLKTHPAYLPSERGYGDRPNVVGRCQGTGGEGRFFSTVMSTSFHPAPFIHGSIPLGQERSREIGFMEEGLRI